MVRAGLLLYNRRPGIEEDQLLRRPHRASAFAEVADEVQSLYLEGKREEAYAAIPDELVDATAMIGTEDEVAERVKRFATRVSTGCWSRRCTANPEQNLRTLEKLADMVGAGSPA